ncbi:hypothetical protein BD408DRAFT_416873 [Parasitella parasitica]|nr:hypothetical protein BD408DRAFT_416873 [Parasitella parasitica]
MFIVPFDDLSSTVTFNVAADVFHAVVLSVVLSVVVAFAVPFPPRFHIYAYDNAFIQ